jgi:hypothetical protein
MNKTRALLGFAASLTLLTAAPGCGLLDDATTFTLETDWKAFTVDSSALGVAIPGATVPAVPCTSQNDICAQSSSGISCSGQTYACTVQCGAQGSCEIVATAEVGTTVDVSDKVKNQTSASALSKVSFTRMLYRATENTLSFDTPQITIFVGPNGATKTTDAGVVKFATMPAVPKGQKPSGEVNATDQGKAALAGFVQNYSTPFKVFVKASLEFQSGDPLPQGRFTMEVNGFFQVEAL